LKDVKKRIVKMTNIFVDEYFISIDLFYERWKDEFVLFKSNLKCFSLRCYHIILVYANKVWLVLRRMIYLKEFFFFVDIFYCWCWTLKKWYIAYFCLPFKFDCVKCIGNNIRNILLNSISHFKFWKKYRLNKWIFDSTSKIFSIY